MGIFRKKKRFPTFAILLLVLGLVWLANSMELISINIPWMPVTLVVVAIGMIFNRLWDN